MYTRYSILHCLQKVARDPCYVAMLTETLANSKLSRQDLKASYSTCLDNLAYETELKLKLQLSCILASTQHLSCNSVETEIKLSKAGLKLKIIQASTVVGYTWHGEFSCACLSL